MSSHFNLQRAAMLAAVVALALAAGCSQGSVGDGPDTSRGLDCIDDSPRCVNQRRLALDALMADRSRAWIRQPPTVAAYASGVRLFAYKQQRKELTCEQLRAGQREAADAGRTLRGPAGRSLAPSQISRGAMLGDEIARDLTRESDRRCRRR